MKNIPPLCKGRLGGVDLQNLVVGQFEISVRPELVEGHFCGSTGSPRTETNSLRKIYLPLPPPYKGWEP